MARSQISAPQQSHQLFIRGDDGFSSRDRAIDDLARNAGASDQFGNNVNIRMVHYFAPIGSLEHEIEIGDRLVFETAAAHRAHTQRKAELVLNETGVFGENRQRTRANVPEPDNPYVHSVHRLNI